MKKGIFFVDGENFRKSLEEIFINRFKQPDFDILKFDFEEFLRIIFSKEKINLKNKFF